MPSVHMRTHAHARVPPWAGRLTCQRGLQWVEPLAVAAQRVFGILVHRKVHRVRRPAAQRSACTHADIHIHRAQRQSTQHCTAAGARAASGTAPGAQRRSRRSRPFPPPRPPAPDPAPPCRQRVLHRLCHHARPSPRPLRRRDSRLVWLLAHPAPAATAPTPRYSPPIPSARIVLLMACRTDPGSCTQ